MQSHIRKVYACLAVTCHLHFWQDDQDLLVLRATAVTRGWNRYQNKSQHRKLTLEKKILPPLPQGFEPTTFQSRVQRSNHWAVPAIIVTIASQWLFTVSAFLKPSPYTASLDTWVLTMAWPSHVMAHTSPVGPHAMLMTPMSWQGMCCQSTPSGQSRHTPVRTYTWSNKPREL